MNKNKISMIALDLDRTTLREDGTIPERTVSALNRAGELGTDIVIATGRVFDALPAALGELRYIRYYICSNGAAVFRAKSGSGDSEGRYEENEDHAECSGEDLPGKPDLDSVEILMERCLDPAAVEKMVGYVRDAGLMFESFTAGRAYIGRDYYDMVDRGLLMYRSRDYVINTRRPVDDIFGFTLDNKERIENLNVFFPTQEEKAAFRPLLESIPNSTLTSSVPSNYELGGQGVSKGAALSFLMELEGVKPENLMAAGDSPNDITMLELAGVSVAVGNAEESVKSVCSYVAPTNEDAGVGEAVERFVLGERGI